jgi:hypothetical protein
MDPGVQLDRFLTLDGFLTYVVPGALALVSMLFRRRILICVIALWSLRADGDGRKHAIVLLKLLLSRGTTDRSRSVGGHGKLPVGGRKVPR